MVLVSLNRVGATRQSIAKALAVRGVAAHQVLREARLPAAPEGLPKVELTLDERHPELCVVRLDGVWLGTPSARDSLFGYLAAVHTALARSATARGGALVPPGVRAPGAEAACAGDLHELETLDTVEQEVLVNLLRRYSPELIALCGRGRLGGPPDRVGSRWLTESREHLATRYLDSADPRHLQHVRAEIRRHDGIADLLRMDIAPLARPSAATAVMVRCLDAQVSLADLRAQSLLLAAMALHARRTVKNGSREPNLFQQTLDKNRAQAVNHGLRARFLPYTRPGHGPIEPIAARDAVRRLLDELLFDLSLLDATAEELFPLLAPLELPALGLPATRSHDLLARAGRVDGSGFEQRAERELCDARPGGGLLEAVRADSPGRVELLLESWRPALAQGRPSRRSPDRAARTGQRRSGTGGGSRDRETGRNADRGRGQRQASEQGRRQGQPRERGQEQRRQDPGRPSSGPRSDDSSSRRGGS